MEIKDMRVDWMQGYGNHPRIEILVNKIPDFPFEEFKFVKKGKIYYAEKEGIAKFFSYPGDSPGEGFGGSKFEITLKNGDKKTLIGPWSSNSGYVNSLGFGPVINVGIEDSKEKWNRSRCVFGVYILKSKIESKLNKYFSDVVLSEERGLYSIEYIPSLQGFDWRSSKIRIRERESKLYQYN